MSGGPPDLSPASVPAPSLRFGQPFEYCNLLVGDTPLEGRDAGTLRPVRDVTPALLAASNHYGRVFVATPSGTGPALRALFACCCT